MKRLMVRWSGQPEKRQSTAALQKVGAMALVSCLVFTGCVAPDPSRSAAPEDVYAWADVRFEKVVLFKPSAPDSGELQTKLAPLLIRETTNLPASSKAGTFGIVDFSRERLSVDTSQPAVYYHLGSLQLNGEPHTAATYVWFLRNGARRSEPNPVRVEGVRMTLSTAGQPIIWEILNGTEAWELLFVSREVEAAALKEFGLPLPCRKFSTEHSLREAPKTVVARVIEDGPVLMGPIVYLNKAGDVSTLICRCMPAQAKEVTFTETYELLPLSALDPAQITKLLKPKWWPGVNNERAHSMLRIPKGY